MPDFIITKEQCLFTTTAVSNAFIQDFMPSAPGEAVKVYLYGLLLLTSPNDAVNEIDVALGMTQETVVDCFRFWEKQGLVRIIDSTNMTIQYLSAESVAKIGLAGGTGRFAELVDSLKNVFGTRNLSGSELQRIFDWIDIFGFEPSAAVEICRYCLELKGSRVHINYLDAVAKRLAAEKILTFEAVHNNFILEKELLTGAAQILKRWRLNRIPTEDELALYAKWTNAWGFTREAIELACKDVVAIDRPNFKYLDAILGSYHETGDVSVEEITKLMREQDAIADVTRKLFTRAGMKSKPNVNHRKQVEIWLKDRCMNPELLFYAAEICCDKANPFAEMKKLLDVWYSDGIASLPAAKEDVEKKSKSLQKSKSSAPGKKGQATINRALDYKQRTYTADDFKELGISLGEDVYED